MKYWFFSSKCFLLLFSKYLRHVKIFNSEYCRLKTNVSHFIVPRLNAYLSISIYSYVFEIRWEFVPLCTKRSLEYFPKEKNESK